jgi:hypothetical protein
MQLLNDMKRPELYAKDATVEDANYVGRMVTNMNESLKSAGYDYHYVTHFVNGCISITKL